MTSYFKFTHTEPSLQSAFPLSIRHLADREGKSIADARGFLFGDLIF
jgi:hypothetical protein